MEKILNFSFPFSNFSLPQPKVMKRIHNAYYQNKQPKNKIQIHIEFWWRHFNRVRVMFLYKLKKSLKFSIHFSNYRNGTKFFDAHFDNHCR